jgi:ferrous iron transport protein B
MQIEKILLVGNPNVGKSTIFSRLTGANVIISNYPGTTVEFSQGQMKLGDAKAMVIDVPGTYTLKPTCGAEEVAVRMLKEGDVVVNIIDATNLERNLSLTLELLEKKIPVIVALNIWDDTKHRGIHIDVVKLEEQLGVPVVPTCGLTSEGVKKLIDRMSEAKAGRVPASSDVARWKAIGRIVEQAQKLSHRHHTLLERAEDLSIRPLTGLPLALCALFCVFWAIRFIGESLVGYVFEPLFRNIWLPLMVNLSDFLGDQTFLHHIFIGNLIQGKIDFGQSFGMLTTGLYVPVGIVLPYIVSFYLVLGILEDVGYLPRLAVLADNFMHHLGLHGYAIIPFILGLGCNVPGALATRLLEEKREKFIAITLMAIAIPCMAQVAMIVGLVGQRGPKYVAIVFSTLFLILIGKGLILNKILKGTSPEILVEIPPYRIPQLGAVLKKLWMRLYGFMVEALPFVLLGVLFVNTLYALKIMNFFSRLFSPVLTNLWGLPKEAISALVVGFLRKDVAVGMLAPLNLTDKQLVIGSTILAVYFPCIATFVNIGRELGARDLAKIASLMFLVAILVGALLNLIL